MEPGVPGSKNKVKLGVGSMQGETSQWGQNAHGLKSVIRISSTVIRFSFYFVIFLQHQFS